MTLTEWSNYCYRQSLEAGWWADKDNAKIPRAVLYATKIALIHSEISEALEGVRKNIQDAHLPHRQSVEVELADALIRIFDLAGAMNLDLQSVVEEKIEYNKHRHDHKPEVRATTGGKQF